MCNCTKLRILRGFDQNQKNNHGNLNGVNGLPQVWGGGGEQGGGNPGVMGGRSTGGGRRGGGRPDIYLKGAGAGRNGKNFATLAHYFAIGKVRGGGSR